MDYKNVLKTKLDEKSYNKLEKINNVSLHQFIAKYIELCNPDKVFVCDHSEADINYIKERTLANGEEHKLAIEGHTYHFDSPLDQGRDKEHTNILVTPDMKLGSLISTRDRQEGITEIHEILKDIMKGKELFVCFFCLGPTNSAFSIPCIQLTDSSYVAHSESLLYRAGYDEFVRQGDSDNFFRFVHSQGELTGDKVCRNIDNRRIYIDITEDTVYSTNTQYGGNSIGLKKLAMRLAIHKGSKEDWLTEHMLVMGVHGPNNRVSYFAGAFPSLCGKTSTAMLEGETIVGDDIAFFRKIDNEFRAVNFEKGMFGIIQGINSQDDPIQWKALNNKGEVIFSNVLIKPDLGVHWIGKDGALPEKGINYSGEWFPGKKDAKDKEIKCSHPNARFTLSLDMLENADKALHDPKGVKVSGVVYGGRDSDTCVPVEEAFDWIHGIVTKGASIESETTAATIGKEGVREFNPMSNLDFLSSPIGRYIQNNLDFSKGLTKVPSIFSVNYFIKDKEGNFLNEKNDKKVWYKWMELRVNGEVNAIELPTGKIPEYEDIQKLYKTVLKKEYTKETYDKQFMLRVPELLAKIERVTSIYKTKLEGIPEIVFSTLEMQKQRLLSVKEKYGDYITPDKFKK